MAVCAAATDLSEKSAANVIQSAVRCKRTLYMDDLICCSIIFKNLSKEQFVIPFLPGGYNSLCPRIRRTSPSEPTILPANRSATPVDPSDFPVNWGYSTRQHAQTRQW